VPNERDDDAQYACVPTTHPYHHHATVSTRLILNTCRHATLFPLLRKKKKKMYILAGGSYNGIGSPYRVGALFSRVDLRGVLFTFVWLSLTISAFSLSLTFLVLLTGFELTFGDS